MTQLPFLDAHDPVSVQRNVEALAVGLPSFTRLLGSSVHIFAPAISPSSAALGAGATAGPLRVTLPVGSLKNARTISAQGGIFGAFGEQCGWTWGLPGGDSVDFYIRNAGPNVTGALSFQGSILVCY